MSTTMAGAAALLLYLLALAPLALSLLRGRGGKGALLLYAAAFAALLAASADLSPTPVPSAMSTGGAGAGMADAEGCARALQVTDEAGIIIDRRNPRRVVVHGQLWRQLPQEAKDVLISCIAGGDGSEEAPQVEIVERGG